MIIDIYKHYIFDYLDLLSQIRLLATCWTFRNELDMTDMYNIDDKYKYRLTQTVIDKYINLKKLDISLNPKITNVNHLVELEILNASGSRCRMYDTGLVYCINLKDLNA